MSTISDPAPIRTDAPTTPDERMFLMAFLATITAYLAIGGGLLLAVALANRVMAMVG